MRRLLVLVAASTAISTAALGQDTRPDSVACRDSAAAGLYRRCALWMEGNTVKRGEGGQVVGRWGFFIPTPLTRLVAGDSAMYYARRFERRSKQSVGLLVLGAAVMVFSVSKADCGGTYDGCQYDYGFSSPGFNTLLAGAVLSGIGAHLQVRAMRAGARAVWWNNERFAR